LGFGIFAPWKSFSPLQRKMSRINRAAKSAPPARSLFRSAGALIATARKGLADLLARAAQLPLPVKIAIVVVTLAVAAYFVFFTPGLLNRGGKGKKLAAPAKSSRTSSRVAKAETKAEPQAKSPSPKKKAASPGPAKRSASKSKKSKK